MSRAGPIRNTEPLVRQVLEAVRRSGMLDKQIAAEAKITANELSCWRRGVVNPPLPKLSRVAAAIGAELVVQERQS